MLRATNSAILLLVLVLLAAAQPRDVAAQAGPPTLATYEGWLREAFAAAQRGDRLGLEQVAPKLNTARQVALPQGGVAPVDNSWLAQELAASEPDLPRISGRLGALLDALGQVGNAAPADANERLRQILNRPPFLQQAPQRSLLSDLIDWLIDMLDRIMSPLGRAGAASSSSVAWLATIGGSVLIVGIVAYVLFSLRRSLVREASAADADPEANLTATLASKQATELARSGDYRTAVRYLYLSALLWLDERELLRYDRALTNREYLEHLRDNGELRSRLLPIVETFDRVWYGYTPLDAPDFEAYRRQVEALRQ